MGRTVQRLAQIISVFTGWPIKLSRLPPPERAPSPSPTRKTLAQSRFPRLSLPMGLFSWWRGGRRGGGPPDQQGQQSSAVSGASGTEVATSGTHGAVEVRRQRQAADATVFEFGSAAESGAALTLAGYCPVSDELEPCRWELVPAAGEGAPQFRIVF